MRIHFIDDCPIDMRWMSQLFSKDPEIHATTATSVADIFRVPADDTPDCIFLDVMRPDAVSIEDDVSIIRRRTTAPVVFVTGGEALPLRSFAIDAGAEGVIEKSQMTREVVLQFARNAIVRTSAGKLEAAFRKQREIALGWREPDGSAPRRIVETAFLRPVTDYLSASLRELKEQMAASHALPTFSEMLEESGRAASGLDRFMQREAGALQACDLAEVCKAARIVVDPIARRNRISVFWDVKPVTFDQPGGLEDGAEGLALLVLAFIQLADENSVLLISSERPTRTSRARLTLYGTGESLLRNWHRLGGPNEPHGARFARASLSLGLQLLGVSSDDLRIGREEDALVARLSCR